MPVEYLAIPMDPFPAPRMVSSDRWKGRPIVKRYNANKDLLRIYANKHKIKIGDVLGVAFVIKMPKSWSEKKKVKMNGQPHQQRPDLDNMIKAVKDTLLKEDSHVWKYEPAPFKVWGYESKILIVK